MKKYYFIFFLWLGLFFMPSNALACGNSSERSCCKKEITTTKKEQNNCCHNDRTQEKEPQGCQGDCGHSECGCTAFYSAFSGSLLTEIYLNNNLVSYSSFAKPNFLYTIPSILDGFYTIWLIPKIG